LTRLIMTGRLRYQYAGILVLCLLTGCRAMGVLFPEIDHQDKNWLKTESLHYFIYCRPESPASQDMQQIAEQLDSCYEDVLTQLDVGFSARINYYLYSSKDDLEQWVGRRVQGFFIGEFDYAVEVYDSRRASMNSHETVHFIAYHTVGVSELIFLYEGLAEAIAHCHDRTARGKLTMHDTCGRLLAQDGLFPLEVLTDNDRFEQIYLSPEVSVYYCQCGSFVRYLIDKYGLTKLKSLVPRTREDNYRMVFEAVYGKTVEDLDTEWREFLRDY
jgi:hypothetical protein